MTDRERQMAIAKVTHLEKEIERLRKEVVAATESFKDEQEASTKLQQRIEELEGTTASLAATEVRAGLYRKRIEELEMELIEEFEEQAGDDI